MSRCRLLLPSVVLGLALFASSVRAEGRVQLELVGDPAVGSSLAFQDWLQALSRAGIQNVRIRTAQEGDKPTIDVRGTDDSPLYVVTGVLGGRDEVLLPGARFRRSEGKQLAAWLDDLAKRGPPDRREPTAAFGLPQKQFDKVQADLAKLVGFSTRNMTRAEAVERIGRRLTVPLKVEGQMADGEDKIEEELSELSCGTALACILRPIGYCMVPRPAASGVGYVVAKARLDQEVWPIGWPTDKPGSQVLPALYEMRNVSLEKVAAADVLRAIGTRIKSPILLDHNALARHGIDPAKTPVSHPQKRTSYSQALRKILFQAGLKFEVRVDEAGNPFVWVSTIKPV